MASYSKSWNCFRYGMAWASEPFIFTSSCLLSASARLVWVMLDSTSSTNKDAIIRLAWAARRASGSKQLVKEGDRRCRI
eukprot:9221560-Heterocapsa_arctica.AAC.1